ncbi:MAG: hypothetical protein JZU50_13640 [Desulfobulbaceae bacterium]|nr:hypothetical protein [Desulfobulbaceae bacterium]
MIVKRSVYTDKWFLRALFLVNYPNDGSAMYNGGFIIVGIYGGLVGFLVVVVISAYFIPISGGVK